jgi:hypothetical protein
MLFTVNLTGMIWAKIKAPTVKSQQIARTVAWPYANVFCGDSVLISLRFSHHIAGNT